MVAFQTRKKVKKKQNQNDSKWTMMSNEHLGRACLQECSILALAYCHMREPKGNSDTLMSVQQNKA
jgi:hypothetical protein